MCGVNLRAAKSVYGGETIYAKKALRFACFVLAVFSVIFFGFVAFLSHSLPDRYSQSGNNLPVIHSKIDICLCESERSVSKNLSSALSDEYQAQIKMFGVLPVKNVIVEKISEHQVVLGGTPFGIEIFSDGVMVVSITPVVSVDGNVIPAEEADIKVGDIILAINGTAVSSNTQVSEIIEKCEGKTLEFSMKRKDKSFTANLRPALAAADGKFKAGLWVRDSCAGLGTLTFYDPRSGVCAGLGHAVCDVDTGEVIPISTGEIYSASIDSVQKSTKGTTGQLVGHMISETLLGSLLTNCETGVYGLYKNANIQQERIYIAMKHEAKTGEAQILTTLSGGEPTLYDCEIESLNYSDDDYKNIVVKVTDTELLNVTGGIVQGMSGSPIIQNGKLVGAVTHVLINEPTKGYGIFAETMLETAQSVSEEELQSAS